MKPNDLPAVINALRGHISIVGSMLLEKVDSAGCHIRRGACKSIPLFHTASGIHPKWPQDAILMGRMLLY